MRLHEEPRRRHAQHLLRSSGLFDCTGSDKRTDSPRMVGRQWNVRTPAASVGLTHECPGLDVSIRFPLPASALSRVFTIDNQTYQVCFDCARQVPYPQKHVRPDKPPGAGDNPSATKDTKQP